MSPPVVSIHKSLLLGPVGAVVPTELIVFGTQSPVLFIYISNEAVVVVLSYQCVPSVVSPVNAVGLLCN